MKFKVLPHTADVRLKVFGKTKKELFKNAMLGMAEILKYQISIRRLADKSQKLFKAKIQIKSPDIDSLLVDFLSEVLYQSQINKAVYHDVKFFKFSNTEISAEIYGVKVGEFDKDIKAATYHELEIKKSPPTGGRSGFETIIIFDV